MLTVRPHSSLDYAKLPNIDTSNVGTLTERDLACLDSVGNCVVQADAQERFGVSLLHSHFPIRSDEIVVEEAHFNEGFLTVRPIRNAPPNLLATTVCFDVVDPVNEEIQLVGLEFAPEEVLAGVSPLNDADRDLLTKIARILHRDEKTRRFGIRLLHNPLKLDKRVLLETCDSIGRILTCRCTDEDDPSFTQSIATVFRWETGNEAGLAIGQECMQFCRRVQACNIDRNGTHRLH
jgi:hypothetical protein